MIYANPLKADTMKKLFLLLALLPSLAFADVDTELNETYQQVLKHRKEITPLIIQSQRDWIKFINSDCKSYAVSVKDELPQTNWVIDECLITQKIQRTKTLKDTYLNH
jgi:uncharacterized protein YecT (DUF1311 family)